MSVTPGWTESLLDDITNRGSGHTPDQSKRDYWDGRIGWVSLADSNKLDNGYIESTARRITPLGIAKSSAVLHPAETVILSRDAGVGKSAVLRSQMAVSQHFIAWDCNTKSVLDPWFLYYWLQNRKSFFERMAVGSTIKTIGLPLFRRLPITYPPLPEQRKIAEILRTWDDAIDAELRLLEALKHRRALIREKLFRISRERGARMVFDDILTESRNPGTTGDTAQKITVKLYGKGAVPKLGRSGSASTRYYRRSAGQLIYSKLDFLNGAFAVIPQELDGYESTLDLPTFDIDASVNPTWLIGYLTRPSYYTNQAHLARGQRKARRISPTEFLAEPLGVPSRELQDTTAIILNEASAEVGKQQELLAQLQIQKRGLMQKLLTGEIRVTGDVAESLGEASIV